MPRSFFPCNCASHRGRMPHESRRRPKLSRIAYVAANQESKRTFLSSPAAYPIPRQATARSTRRTRPVGIASRDALPMRPLEQRSRVTRTTGCVQLRKTVDFSQSLNRFPATASGNCPAAATVLPCTVIWLFDIRLFDSAGGRLQEDGGKGKEEGIQNESHSRPPFPPVPDRSYDSGA